MEVGAQVNIDKDRVAILLLINSSLIKKAHEIYIQVLSNKLAIQQMPPQSRQIILEQYNNINRRLQCNLSVLIYLDGVYGKKIPAQQSNRINFPVILSPPPEMPELRSLYKRLQELYPEALEFLKTKMNQMKQQETNGAPFNTQHPLQGLAATNIPQGVHQGVQQEFPQAHNNGSAYIEHQPAPQQEQSQKSQHYQDPQHQQQVQHQPHTISSYSLPQKNTPPQYPTPHVTKQPLRKQPSSITSKIPVQHHLPHHHQKRFDISSGGGISPQMMSKESAPSYGDHTGPINHSGGTNNGETKISSISPQQILQQQHQSDDSTMGFL